MVSSGGAIVSFSVVAADGTALGVEELNSIQFWSSCLLEC